MVLEKRHSIIRAVFPGGELVDSSIKGQRPCWEGEPRRAGVANAKDKRRKLSEGRFTWALARLDTDSLKILTGHQDQCTGPILQIQKLRKADHRLLCSLENQPRMSGHVETHESTQSPLRQCWFVLLGGVAQHTARAPACPHTGSGKLNLPEGLRNSTLNSHLFSKLSHTLFLTCAFLLSTGIQKNQI